MHKLQDGQILFRRHEPSSHDPEGNRKDVDNLVCARIMDVLLADFPGHPWHLTADTFNGIATIHIPVFMREDRYVLHLNRLDSGNFKRTVRNAAGHLLERYRIPRGRFDAGAFLAAQVRYAPMGASSVVPE